MTSEVDQARALLATMREEGDIDTELLDDLDARLDDEDDDTLGFILDGDEVVGFSIGERDG